ncbi:MAG TPA: hypothetical protein VK337_10050 [Xanthobacteraceae bacterium]|nr:hypothetical protein [Xanthobacteraceae bacterium]
MNGQWTITIAPVAGLALNVLTQIMTAHLSRGKIGASIIIGILGGLALTLAVIALAHTAAPGATGGFADTWLLGVTTYLALAFGFWAFLNLNITSLRIRILRELVRAGGSLALSDMPVLYSGAERLRRRLERLENGGQIVCKDGRWRLRSWQVLAIARCVEALRNLILPRSARERP